MRVPNKDVMVLVRKAEKTPGWQVELTGGHHVKFLPPDGSKPILVGGTPSKGSVTIARRLLKKAGLS